MTAAVLANARLVLTLGGAHAPTPAQRDAVVRILRARLEGDSLTVEVKGDRRLILTADSFDKHFLDPGIVTFRVEEKGGWQSRLALGTGDVAGAHALIDQIPSSLRLNLHDQATRRLADLTAGQVGHRFALFLDDELVWSTTLRAPIRSGELFVVPSVSDSDLVRIVHYINLGPLPVPVLQ